MTIKDDFLRHHPREGLHLILLCAVIIWQTGIAIFGLILYLIFIQLLCCRWWMMVCAAVGIIFMSSLIDYFYHVDPINIIEFLQASFKLNKYFWEINFSEGLIDGAIYLYHYEFIYLVSFSILLSGLLAIIDLFFLNPHKEDMAALQKKKRISDLAISPDLINKRISALSDTSLDGTILGISMLNGEAVIIKDKYLNQIALVLGTTGGGKTITMRRFYQRAIQQAYPLIIVDGKPTEKNVEWVKNLAQHHGRAFYGFNCADQSHYDALSQGGYTELKDKIITLKDEWSSDYYRSIAEAYLQTVFAVLIQLRKPFDLSDVADCLDYDHLCTIVRDTKNNILMERVEALEQYEKKEITGLQAHLHILLHSELGHYFKLADSTINLSNVIEQNAVVYFALPALKFPSFSKVLGKLVANDLKAVIGRSSHKNKKIFAVFDEYSVFAGEQSLNLANMGRENGLHVLFGTQGLADLAKIDKSFMEQITNCANTIICHRLNDHVSAELVAKWVGTKKEFSVTAQINVMEGDSGMGTVREAREFIVHPDEIKQELSPGEAFYITKVDGFRVDKVRVKFG
ncbi:MAG: type IV secretion system DNA-binding domain-containing protein [Gammaproteobacteria bacterium]|nr:type IV secretion system DNA-binding domain-containing protein [Gammaproteobacteria bacterium]